MPTYSYSCTHCDEKSERLVPIIDRDEQLCNVCFVELKRLIDRPGAVWAPSSSSGGMKV